MHTCYKPNRWRKTCERNAGYAATDFRVNIKI